MIERIVVSSQSQGGLDDMVSSMFGRCPAYTIVDIDLDQKEIKEVTTQNNPAMQAMGGAGIQAAQLIGNLGAKVVISGNFGPNAFVALQQLGIKILAGVFGISVKEAVDQYLAGSLTPVAGPTAPMHAGMGMGRGMAMGRGMGRGMGMGMGQPGAPMVSPPPTPPMSREEEITFLKDHLKGIEEEVSRLKARLEKLKSEDK